MMEENNRMRETQVKADDVAISERGQQPPQNIPEVGNMLQEIPANQTPTPTEVPYG